MGLRNRSELFSSLCFLNFIIFMILVFLVRGSIARSVARSVDDEDQKLREKIQNLIFDDNFATTSWPRCGEVVNFDLESVDNLSSPELPFLAMIFRQQNDQDYFALKNSRIGKSSTSSQDLVPLGTAAILTPQYLITTAHQFLNLTSQDLASLRVGVGSSDYHAQHRDHRISAVRIHRLSHGSTFLYDIALVKLETPLQFSEHVGAVCLPEGVELDPTGKQFVAEWDLEQPSNSFLTIGESIAEFWFDCARNHMNFGAWDGHNGPKYPIECSRRPESAHQCFGNFGSVLLKRANGNQITLIGIAQKAKHNCHSRSKHPGLVTFTEMDRFSSWIASAIWDMTNQKDMVNSLKRF